MKARESIRILSGMSWRYVLAFLVGVGVGFGPGCFIILGYPTPSIPEEYKKGFCAIMEFELLLPEVMIGRAYNYAVDSGMPSALTGFLYALWHWNDRVLDRLRYISQCPPTHHVNSSSIAYFFFVALSAAVEVAQVVWARLMPSTTLWQRSSRKSARTAFITSRCVTLRRRACVAMVHASADQRTARWAASDSRQRIALREIPSWDERSLSSA